MTLLHTKALRRALDEKDWDKKLVVTPLLDPGQIGEASIDLRLGNEFLLVRRTVRAGIELQARESGPTVDPNDEALLTRNAEEAQAEINELYDRVVVPFGEGLWLHPQQLALGATFEFIRVPPTLGANVLSRSTWGRLGLLVATAVMVQPEFVGSLTLELVNESNSPIRLYPGIKIGQLALTALPQTSPFWTSADEERHDEEYGAGNEKIPTYRAPTGPQAAQVGKDYKELRRIAKVGQALARI